MNLFFKHGSSQPEKETFYFQIESIKLPIMRNISEGDFLHVAIERSGKVKTSKEYAVKARTSLGDTQTAFNEAISFSVTMYKVSKGKYEEKVATLEVKHRKPKSKKHEVIGMAPLELHELINKVEQPVALALTKCPEGGVVNMRVSLKKPMNSSRIGDDDDSSSVASSMTGSRNNLTNMSSGNLNAVPVSAGKAAKTAATTTAPSAATKTAARRNSDEQPTAPAAASVTSPPTDTSFNDIGFADFESNKTPHNGTTTASDPFASDWDNNHSNTNNTTDVDWGDPFGNSSTSWSATEDTKSGSGNNGNDDRSKISFADGNGNTNGNANANAERIRRAREAAAAGVTVMAANQQLKLKSPTLSSKSVVSKANDDTIEILTTKANYFEAEAARLLADIAVLREERDLLLSQRLELESRLNRSAAETAALGTLVADSSLLQSQLAAKVNHQNIELDELRAQNAALSAELCELEVIVASSRVEMRNKKFEQPQGSHGISTMSPTMHVSVASSVAKLEQNSPKQSNANGKTAKRF